MISVLFLKLIFKSKNFLSKWLNRLERSYDKIRIIETCISFKEPLNVKKNKSFVTKNTVLGRNVSFNGMKIFGQGSVIIGDNFHSGTGCSIITQFHNYHSEESIPYDSTYLIKDVRIGDNVWLGNDVTILGGVSLGEGCIVQVGSVVVSDIPKYAIAGGHPARVFSTRNKGLYEKLKIDRKFH